jgi:hypothetical protein
MTISVNIHRNPLSPECREQRCVQPPMTLRQLTIDANGGASEWPFPTIAIVDGVSWKRGRWNEPLTDGMVVEFRSMLRGGGGNPVSRVRNYASNLIGNAKSDPWGTARTLGSLALGGGAALASGLYTAWTTRMGSVTGLGLGAAAFYRLNRTTIDNLLNGLPQTPSLPSALDGESGSSTYGVEKGNRRRVGEPIPVIYGRMRVYPDDVEDPEIHTGDPISINDETYVKYLLCVGHGSFSGTALDEPESNGIQRDISTTYYSDRATGGSQAININGPVGQDLTTSYTDATADIDLAYSSGYIITGVATGLVYINVLFPSGLFDASSGSIASRSITIRTLAEEYNGATLVDSREKTFTLSAATRKSSGALLYAEFNWTPTQGNTLRISVKRDSAESTNLNIVEKCTFASAILLRDRYSTSGKTIVKISDIVGGSYAQANAGKYSIVLTRKLSAYDSVTGTWGAESATRSIAWALADILKNADYGMGLSDSQIDLDALVALDAIWDARGDYFDGVFDQTITAWEALQKVARCGRAIPVLYNGKITFVRDGEKTVRSAIFNPSNILPGSLAIEYSFRQENEPDGIDLTYIDTATWQEAHVIVAMPGVVGDPANPQKVDLFGCTDVDQATREATYLARRMAYLRKTISWQTEMDGRLLMIGDLVTLAHDVPSWSQSGEVTQIDYPGGNLRCWSSQAIDWSGAGSKYVLMKKPDGSVSGPHAATQATDGFVIADPGWTPVVDLSDGERTTFILYTGTSTDVVITDIVPSGDTACTITAVPYDSRIHDTGA